MDAYPTFAANLARLREERGLTQLQLALEVGLGQSDIGDIERGVREPRVTTIAKLAAGLDVHPGELFDDPRA